VTLLRNLSLAVLAALLLAEGFASPKFVVEGWQMQDGLPSDNIRNVVQTRDGYLWVATFHGLARFDGVEFKVSHLANTPALRNNLINRLYEDRDGRLWIGHDTGEVTVYSGGEFRAVPFEAAAPKVAVERFAQSADGTVWMLYRNGALRSFRQETAGPVIPPRGAQIVGLETDSAGTVWVAYGDTVTRLVAGQDLSWTEGCPPPGLVRPRIVTARRGGIWVIDRDLLRRWHEGHWAEERRLDGRLNLASQQVLETSTGLFLLGGVSVEGLRIVAADGTMEPADVGTGNLSGWVRCLTEDAEGSLWLGTGGNGLRRLRPRRVEMLNPPDRWQNRPVRSVTARVAGGVSVGTEGAGVYRQEAGRWERLGEDRQLRTLVTKAVLEDRRGTLWVVSPGAGGVLQAFDGTGFKVIVQDPALGNPTALWETHRGELWVGSQVGPALLQGALLHWPASGGKAELANTRCFAEGADGAIWVGTLGSGVARLQDGVISRWRQSDGLVSDFVLSLQAEPEGSVWAGTYGHGLSRIQGGRCATVSSRHGLPSDVIFSLLDDEQGHFWMSSPAGIFRVAKADLHRCADGQLDRVPCVVLDLSDGLATLEMAGDCQPVSCRTADGRLWFATAKGLARVNPADVQARPKPTPVVIAGLRADGREVSFPRPGSATDRTQGHASAGPVALGPDLRYLEIEYAGLSLVAPRRVRFQYRLEGLEGEWNDAGTRRTAYYHHLPPGDYVFRVRASNDDGVWNPAGAILALQVVPYFWETGWFAALTVMLGAAGVAGLAFGIVRRRFARALVGLEQRQAIERERARIARDIHDDLGAGLTQVTLLTHTAKGLLQHPEKAAERLDAIQASAYQMTQAMDEIVWAVNPQHDSLDSLVAYLGKFAQDFLGSASVRCMLDFPLALPSWPLTAEVRHGVFLAFKEALHNVIKHAAATEVHIALTVAPEFFSLSVEDNGVGLCRSPFPATSTHGRIASGLGVKGMKQRLEQFGGEVILTDRVGGGTAVQFRISRQSGAPGSARVKPGKVL
jgi:signal transduction histidine kinase/ligand-binding sensor domain-containing protein